MTDREAEAFVEFVDVAKTYDGETLVVRGLDLAIRRGEFLTLLGPSGSGKTTTLMMLAGFETPTRGRILLEGKAIDALPPWRRDIGMVFQNYALFPHMTVRENVAFPLTVRGIRGAEAEGRVERALDMVKLGGFGGRRPAQLSGGQQQRVALARALVFEPRLVLMDEPLGALDKQLREHMQLEIKHLHRSLGVTVVYVTHDQGEALTMSDRIAVFHEGAIDQLAAPDDLYDRPETAFVAQFIGENNRLAGTVEALAEGRCTVTVDGGGTVLATPVGRAGQGVRATLSIRPERVRLSPGDEAGPNRFPARIEELIFHGDHTRARLSLLGRDDFVLKLPNADGRPAVAQGEAVTVGWSAADCRALTA
ncbi:ABC transporter ATP-binding protein [Inquilinus limosus]|uniref:ABC transporter ATP-binding protein n=1 Tax=Inquilinus limosus TaxID=171674 RepID=UPI000408BA93|nr:ABC transporter ATP-binding protein [Inquilinus limosus]